MSIVQQTCSYAVRHFQWAVFLLINCTFVFKYSQRTPLNPWLCIPLYLLFIFFVWHICSQRIHRHVRALTVALLAVASAAILLLLLKIDPLSVNVDRWSATTYFLDGLFSGSYPYGIHTHVCETNFPSPFPLWHYLNIPFWWMGDVGLALIPFLLFFTYIIYRFTRSWRQSLLATILLLSSPSYWWEVAVRSDGLNNAILIFGLILMMERRHISFRTRWLFTSILCGLAACTRLSAIIPMAIYVSYDYFRIPLRRQAASMLVIVAVLAFFFAPYILWDTHTWIFFQRNPFLSQTSTGSPIIMILMIGMALYLALKQPRSISLYLYRISLFIFFFFAVSISANHILHHPDISIWQDAEFDVSYLTLALPYCLFAIIHPEGKKNTSEEYEESIPAHPMLQ